MNEIKVIERAIGYDSRLSLCVWIRLHLPAVRHVNLSVLSSSQIRSFYSQTYSIQRRFWSVWRQSARWLGKSHPG